MSEEDFQPGGDRFPPTRRSVIEAVRSIDAEKRERGLEALCAAYWKPVYKYVRWRWKGARPCWAPFLFVTHVKWCASKRLL